MPQSLNRFFGGSPLGVLLRLVMLSVIVGVALSVLGFDPYDIWASFERLIEGGWRAVADAVQWGWRYFLLGAVLVFPLWLLRRIIEVTRKSR